MHYNRVPSFSAFCIWVLHRLPRVPDLPCICRARVTRRRRPLPEPLQVCTALPSPTRRPITPPPPVLPPLAVPLAATSGRRCRAAATHPRGTSAPLTVLSLARDCPSLSLSSTRPCSPIKPDPNPYPRLLSSSSSSRHRARRHTPSPEFAATASSRPNPSCPPLPHLLH
jgi:hypothetical protein